MKHMQTGLTFFVLQLALFLASLPEKNRGIIIWDSFWFSTEFNCNLIISSKCDILVTVLFTKQYINNDHWLLSM